MVTAYIAVKSMVGNIEALRDEIRDIEGVVDAHIVAGDVDIITKIDVPDTDEIRDLVTARLHGLDGVESTETYIAMT